MKSGFLPAWCALVATLAGCSNTREPSLDRPEIAVVRIQLVRPDGAVSGSRGFFVSPDGLLVACRHGVIGGQINVIPNTGASLPGQIVQEDEAADVALIKVPGVGFPILHLTTAEVGPGLRVRVIGAGGAALGTFNQWDDFGRTMEITARVGAADAGSPLLADDGSVVGLVRGPTLGEPTGQRATPAWRIARMMPMQRDRSEP